MVVCCHHLSRLLSESESESSVHCLFVPCQSLKVIINLVLVIVSQRPRPRSQRKSCFVALSHRLTSKLATRKWKIRSYEV